MSSEENQGDDDYVVASTGPGTQGTLDKLILLLLTPLPPQAMRDSSIPQDFTGLRYVTIVHNTQKHSSICHHELPAQYVQGWFV